MHKRLRSNITKPKKFTDGTVRYAASAVHSCTEPTCYKEAVQNAEGRRAMDEEFAALKIIAHGL